MDDAILSMELGIRGLYFALLGLNNRTLFISASCCRNSFNTNIGLSQIIVALLSLLIPPTGIGRMHMSKGGRRVRQQFPVYFPEKHHPVYPLFKTICQLKFTVTCGLLRYRQFQIIG